MVAVATAAGTCPADNGLARPCRFRTSASASLLRRIEQAGLRSHVGSARACAQPPALCRSRRRPSHRPRRRRKRRRSSRAARASAARVSVLPARSVTRAKPRSSGRSGCASSAIRHSAAKLLGQARDPLIDQLAAKPAGDQVQVGAGVAGARGERARQPLADLVERAGPAARRSPAARASGRPSGRTARARVPRAARGIAARGAPSSASCGEQLGANRHGDLGGRGRRRRAQVGGKVDQRRVGLMARPPRSAGSAIRRRRAPPLPR